MPKYKVCYSGYSFIEAKTKEDAEAMWKFFWPIANASVDVVMEVDGERRTDEK